MKKHSKGVKTLRNSQKTSQERLQKCSKIVVQNEYSSGPMLPNLRTT